MPNDTTESETSEKNASCSRKPDHGQRTKIAGGVDQMSARKNESRVTGSSTPSCPEYFHDGMVSR